MIEINRQQVGKDSKPYIVAEVGINAWDDLRLAKQFIKSAAENGTDAVKFQTHIADAEMAESAMREIGAGEVYDTVQDCEWSRADHKKLQSYAEANNVTFLSTPFSIEAIDLLEEIDVPAIKIGSGELTNRELLERAGETGKPLIVSTGMHTQAEIESAAEFLNSVAEEFLLLYCVSEYPTSPSDFDFGTINMLENITGRPAGFSDHSTDVEAAKAAIGNGAVLVEKHFTLDRRLPGPDQEVSIEPGALSNLCSFASMYHKTRTKKDQLQGEEEDISEWARHSVVATKVIEPGEQITRENTTTKRPGTGIPADRYQELLGTSVKKRVAPGSMLLDVHL